MMNLKKYFLAVGALLCVGNVSAELVEREKPTLSFSDVKTDGTYMYMYNVGAEQFFCGANDWGTRASVGKEGYKMYFRQYQPDGTWDGKTVEFWNFASKYMSSSFNEYSVFIDSYDGTCYVDRASQSNYYWNLTKNTENGYYRLSMAKVCPDYDYWSEFSTISGTYFGWDAALDGGTNTRLWAFLDPAVETNHVDWVFCTEEDMLDFSAKNEVYKAAELLKEQLVLAAEKGITNVSAQEAVFNNLSSTKEEIETATAEVRSLILQNMGENSDVTDFIVNSDFSQGTTGWNGSWTDLNYGCMEAYATEFDAYQVIAGVPAGIYEVSVQAFFRQYRGQEAYDRYKNGQQNCTGYVYLNNHLNKVKCLFDEVVREDNYIFSNEAYSPESNPSQIVDPETGDYVYFANDMQTASEAFAEGMYQNIAVGLVGQNGDELRIGVKGSLQYEEWLCWDNFKLIYRGKQLQYTQPRLEETIAEAQAIIEIPMALDAYEALEEAINNAEDKVSGTDEEAVFAALVQLYGATEAATASIEYFAKLTNKVSEVEIAMSNYRVFVSDEFNGNTEELLAQIWDGLDNYTLTSADVEGLLVECENALSEYNSYEYVCNEINNNIYKLQEAIYKYENTASQEALNTAIVLQNQLNEVRWNSGDVGLAYSLIEQVQPAITAMVIGDPSRASDDAPMDMTELIRSANFEDEWGNTTIDGWYCNGSWAGSNGLIECYNSTIDLWQDFSGLPNGTYRIEVSAFYRYGWIEEDYQHYLADPTQSLSYMYAVTYNGELSKPINLLSSMALTEEPLEYYNYTTFTREDGAVMYVPNDMYSASQFFNAGCGKHVMYVDVVDGTLRLGMKKEDLVSGDWLIMDNFKLYYHGTNSAYQGGVTDVPTEDDIIYSDTNIFSVSDKKVYHGTTLNIPVSMSNADAITAFQCDLYLSEGVYLNINEDGDYDVVLNSDRATSSHTIATSLLPNGAIRVVAYSSSNKQFKNNEGELFSLNLNVSYNANPLQSVTFKNINVSTPEASEYHIRPIRSNIDVYTYRPADVNDDGQVTVSDLTAVDSYMLERGVVNFIFDAADMDLNGLISVADAVSIVNVLLGGEANYADTVRNPVDAQPSYTHACGTLAPEIYRGDSFTLPITLNNEETISAFQCDIYLPEGFILNSNTNRNYEVALNTARVSDHKLSVSKLSDGALRVIIYSASNAPILGNDGALFTLGLTADESIYGDCSVSIRNIRMSTAAEVEILAPVVASNVYVHDYIPADVNGDRTISIVDVVAIVNYLLGDTPSKFIFNAADMDGNGQITIVDVVSVVNALLGGNTYSAQTRSIVRSDIHVADAEVMAGETTTLYVQLDNAQSFTAMQMDVNLPVGLSIENVAMVGNGSHDVVCNEEGRIVAYSLSNRPFNAGETLMAITVKADETFIGSAQVDFTNVRVVSKDINETILGDASSTIIGGSANGVDTAVATLKVTTDGERIIIETSAIQQATIVSATGVVQQVELVAGKNEVTVNGRGLYLVKIGGKTIKVVI